MPNQQNGERPQIQELSSTTFETEKAAQQQQVEEAKEVAPPFSWEDAEKVEAKHTFVNQGEMVFATFHFKGYDKDKDVRYALSDDEVLLEVRDVSKNKVHRICNTLLHKIDAQESTIQLFVDYIVLKLVKQEKRKTWDSLGSDISNFAVPESHTSYMRSNFLK